MSWETLVVGDITFKPNLSKEEINKLIEEIGYILELKEDEYEIKNIDGKVHFEFESLNWSSHVDGDKIKKVYKKIKDKTVFVSIELWYLSEPDEKIYRNEEEKIEEIEIYS
jgi:uncharacterized protein (DUF2164 family)